LLNKSEKMENIILGTEELDKNSTATIVGILRFINASYI